MDLFYTRDLDKVLILWCFRYLICICDSTNYRTHLCPAEAHSDNSLCPFLFLTIFHSSNKRLLTSFVLLILLQFSNFLVKFIDSNA